MSSLNGKYVMAKITSSLIELDRAADTLLPLTFRDKTTKQPIDISGADIKFVVKSGFTLIPEIDPSNPLGRLLHFTEAHAAQLSSKAKPFMVTRTVDGIDQVLWRGEIVAVGFAQ